MDNNYSESEGEYVPRYVSEEVLDFLRHFRDAINMGNVYDIERFYEHEFPKLSDRYYKNEEWPHQLDILNVIEDDVVFGTLYNELCYRHLYARLPGGPSCEQRIASFLNYCDFFNLILSGAYPVTLKLPNIWLWELVDEFVYQFQNFAQYRNRTADRTKHELKLVSNRNIWSILCVLNVFHSLIEKSNIKLQLEVEASGGDPETVAGEYGRLPFYKMLGYFSIIGLLRVHSILGDYYQAIKILEPIEIQKKTQFTQIPACQVTTSYYVGYAYMMMRRYSDAIRTFSSILLYIQRTKQLYSQRSYQNDQINKQTEQMYHLLAMCLVLNPQYIDESIQQALRDKMHNDNMYKMQCGEKEVFKSFFTFASPKFVLPYIRTVKMDPDSEDPEDVILNEDEDEELFRDPMENQIKIFLTEIEQQLQLPTIRTYLKMYTTLPLEKLASFIVMKKNNNEPDPEPNVNKLLIQLLCLKHKMKSVVWTKGASALDGTISTGSELDFYIDDDMIHIADTKVSQRYGDFFIRRILKFEELNRRLHNSKV